MSPIFNNNVPPKNKEKDPNKLGIANISAGFGPFHNMEKEIEQQRIQKLFNHQKFWAVCINLINNMSKVQGVNTDHVFERLRTLCLPRKRLGKMKRNSCAKKKKNQGFLSKKARQKNLTTKKISVLP